MSGHVTLADAIAQIQHGDLTDRGKGLVNLIRILRHNQDSSIIQEIGEKSFHAIYEILFKVAVSDKSIWLKTTTKTTRSALDNRLSACARALREAVEVGVPNLKTKTLSALIDHVSDTMLLSSGELCSPVALEYAKVLGAILCHQPHVEHLPKSEWARTAELCIKIIGLVNIDMAEDNSMSGVESRLTAGSYPGSSSRSILSSRSSFKDQALRHTRFLVKQVSEEMVFCLSFLTAAPNASITSHQATSIVWPIIEFLDRASLGGRYNRHAFKTINHILAWARTEDVYLMQKVTQHIICLTRHFWTQKSPALKDEMLIAVLYLKPYILRLVDQPENVHLHAELADLLEVMRADYAKLEGRKQLQIDDLYMTGMCRDAASVRVSTLSLRSNRDGAEHRWAFIHVLGFLTGILIPPTCADDCPDGEEAEVGTRPHKRQKLSDEFDELLAATANTTGSTRSCALQTFLFLMQDHRLAVNQLADIIDRVSAVYGDDSGSLSAWAFLVLATCAAQSQSRDLSLSSRWSSAWQLGLRGMTNTATCRTACRLLDVMLQVRLAAQSATVDLLHMITYSIDINGPSHLVDAAASFLNRVVKTAQQSNPGTASITAESVLAWVLRNFVPSSFEDRIYATHHSLLDYGDIVHLIGTCLDHQSHDYASYRFHVWRPIAQVWLACDEQEALLSYLLLQPRVGNIFHTNLDRYSSEDSSTISESQSRSAREHELLNCFSLDLRKTQERWDSMRQDRGSAISHDMFAFMCTACCALVCISNCHVFEDKKGQRELQGQVLSLLETVCKYASDPGCSQDKYDSLLLRLAHSFTGLHGCEAEGAHAFSKCERVMCAAASASMSLQDRHHNWNDLDLDQDEMDMEFSPDSQGSQRDGSTGFTPKLKNDRAVMYSHLTLRFSTILYANLVTYIHGQDSSKLDPGNAATQFVDDIVGMSGFEILGCRAVLVSLQRCGVYPNKVETERLLEAFTEDLLSAYQYGRSEIATGTILDVMLTLTTVWTDARNESLFKLGLDTYDWFTEQALSAAVLSPAVQRKVAELLIKLCDINTEYGEGNDVPSVLKTLYKLLQLGNISVLHQLAGQITSIFERYVLSAHGDMFDELQMYLPTDAGWIEGLSMRLLFLSNLAAAWPSLLRPCVYYMFETATIIKTSTQHVARCIDNLTSELNFSSPRELFTFFAPQLVHTFLENKRLMDLPFAAFKFSTLEELLHANRIEITAQLLMRGSEDELQFLITSLKISAAELVEIAFAKCVAYATAWDIAQPQVGGRSPADADARVRKHIASKEKWKQLIVDYFPTILGHFYISVSELDDMHDVWLEKKDRYHEAHKALLECKSYSHSTRELSQSQQPSFKSKRLCDQIERLCRRTEKVSEIASFHPVRPWDISSFPLAVRMLLDSIHTALGSLHMCTVLRKLRLLICMAGPIALSGFPLEMLLHSIRPFLNDTQSADDAIGVLHYLLRHGQRYLVAETLPSTVGVVMLMIVQMREHSTTTQDNTTQQLQHQATVQVMGVFQDWLIQFMRHSHGAGDGPEEAFYSALTEALAKSRLPGNGCHGSEESKLLLLLLDQLGASKPLLSNADCHEALSLLCKSFRVPASISNDCLSDDHDAQRYASTIWHVIQTAPSDDGFNLWAARVLGRSYASSGTQPSPIGKDHVENPLPSRASKLSQGSQATIALKLSTMMTSRDRVEAGLADHTLRLVPWTFLSNKEAISFQQMLPNSLSSCMEKGPHGYIPLDAVDVKLAPVTRMELRKVMQVSPTITDEEWVRTVAVKLCQYGLKTPVIPALPALLRKFSDVAKHLLPAIVHLALLQEEDTEQILKEELSICIAAHLKEQDTSMCTRQRFIVKLLLYLRGQPWPGESSQAKRLDCWVTVDYLQTAETAVRCGMATAALLMVELLLPVERDSSKRKSRTPDSVFNVADTRVPDQLLLRIFRTVEEPDSFYGVQQAASLDSVLDRLDYERDGLKSLMFRSAQMDGSMRTTHQSAVPGSLGIVRSLSALSFNGLTYALLSKDLEHSAAMSSEMLETARKLQQWDVAVSEATPGPAATSFAMFQQLSRATDISRMQQILSSQTLDHVRTGTQKYQPEDLGRSWYSTLAILAEASEVLDVCDGPSLSLKWDLISSRSEWMHSIPFEDCQRIMSNRQTLFSVIAQNQDLSNAMRVGIKDLRAIEARAWVSVSRLARESGVLQEALCASTQLSLLASQNEGLGLHVEAAAKLETASVLWDMGEASVSIKILQDLIKTYDDTLQDIEVGRPGLLAQAGHQLAGARLVKPDDIKSNYLESAIEHLRGRHTGEEAGKVFFEFASFCDHQLQNPGNIEDLNRMAKIRQDRRTELDELSVLRKDKVDNERKYVERSYEKAESWFRVDDAEYQRLKSSRDASIQSSLQYYLMTLQASDLHDICVLRFFALWLENADNVSANDVVRKYLEGVPCWKFVRLLNQLMSRLENVASIFQRSLKQLIKSLCQEHPYHSLHHLYACTRKPTASDGSAFSRYQAASLIRQDIQKTETDLRLKNFFIAEGQYNLLAQTPNPPSKSSKIALKDFPDIPSKLQVVQQLRVPPATISLPLRPDGDYSGVPIVTGFGPQVMIMSGLSAPKVLIVRASNGQEFRQLFKGGNDDLRQDAIMEQVFEEVSKMLRKNKVTRQRGLQVRTYKVIPLTTRSGIIEFVPNSIPINDFLGPAHQKYWPTDMKAEAARNKISVVAKSGSVSDRVKVFRHVCDHLHPVMRHFFLERFIDPDEWFEKRTAYTRTTASVSILGHVLGLGDRHCHNILLDEKSGEVIHIDLGVAFEAGRVLPIPELVPFRMTRDIIDGMGITKTEGVFRRCCEFTMDALREDKDSIMTLLNVLRYDPLVNWTLSPIRAKRMQDAQDIGRNIGNGNEASSKKREQEAGEADRALAIVEKKLSATLSTAATVNELIQAATDENHLATIFHGWAAFY